MNTHETASTHNDAFVVHRVVRVQGLTSRDAVDTVRDALLSLKGMREVIIDSGRQKVRLHYDSSVLNFGDIERTLEQVACPLARSPWTRLKASLFRYMDENARANAEHKPGACCSNPGEIYARSHKRQV